MSTIKKLLVRFDVSKAVAFPGDFLIPRIEQGEVLVRGIESGQIADVGTMVFVGTAITEKELFAKLVDTGIVIENVDATLALLGTYLDQLKSLKIGNVACVRRVIGVRDTCIDVTLIANSPTAVVGRG